MAIKYDEDKLAAFLEGYNELVDEGTIDGEKVTLEDFGEDAAPDYYAWDGYNRATVNYGDRVAGVVVKLKDATLAGGMSIQKASGKARGELSLELMAAFVREHFDGFQVDPDDEGTEQGRAWTKVFISDPPKPGENREGLGEVVRPGRGEGSHPARPGRHHVPPRRWGGGKRIGQALRRLVYKDEAGKDPATRDFSEPDELGDFPPATLDAALEAIYASRTGVDYEGRPLSESSATLNRATRTAIVWEATRKRVALDQSRVQVEASIKLLEAWTTKKQ